MNEFTKSVLLGKVGFLITLLLACLATASCTTTMKPPTLWCRHIVHAHNAAVMEAMDKPGCNIVQLETRRYKNAFTGITHIDSIVTLDDGSVRSIDQRWNVVGQPLVYEATPSYPLYYIKSSKKILKAKGAKKCKRKQ